MFLWVWGIDKVILAVHNLGSGRYELSLSLTLVTCESNSSRLEFFTPPEYVVTD